eukprot:6549288-Prymnesium_polylepis.1
MLTTQPSTYDLISCSNPRRQAVPLAVTLVCPHHAPPSCSPGAVDRITRLRTAPGVARWPLAHPACAPHPA